MTAEDIKTVVCPIIGGISFPVSNLTLGTQYGPRIIEAERKGLCAGCKRKWNEGAQGSREKEPMKVFIEKDRGKKDSATVLRCDPAYTD